MGSPAADGYTHTDQGNMGDDGHREEEERKTEENMGGRDRLNTGREGHQQRGGDEVGQRPERVERVCGWRFLRLCFRKRR